MSGIYFLNLIYLTSIYHGSVSYSTYRVSSIYIICTVRDFVASDSIYYTSATQGSRDYT